MKYGYAVGGPLCRAVALTLLTGFFGNIWSSKEIDPFKYVKKGRDAIEKIKKTDFAVFSKSKDSFLTDINLKPVLFGKKFQKAFWDSVDTGTFNMYIKGETMVPGAVARAITLINFLLFTAAIFNEIEADTFTQPVFEFKSRPGEEWFKYLMYAVKLDSNEKLASEGYNRTGKDTTESKISINLRATGDQEHRYWWLGNPNFKSVAFSLNKETGTWSVWPHDDDTAVPAIQKTAQIIRLDDNELAVARIIVDPKHEYDAAFRAICALAIEKIGGNLNGENLEEDDESLNDEDLEKDKIDDSDFIELLKIIKGSVYAKNGSAILNYLAKKLTDKTEINLDEYKKKSDEALNSVEKKVFVGFSKDTLSFLIDNTNKPVGIIGEQLLEKKFWDSAKHGALFMEQKDAAMQSGAIWLATDMLNFLLFTASVFHKIEADTFTNPLFVFKSVPSEQWFKCLKKTAKRDNKPLTWRDYNLTGNDTTKSKISVNLREKGDQKHRYSWLGNANFKSIAFSLDVKNATWSVWPHDSDKSVPAFPKTAQIIELNADEFEVARAILNAQSNGFKLGGKEFSLGGVCALAIEKYFAAIPDEKKVDPEFIDFLKMAKESAKKTAQETSNIMLKKSDAVFDYLIKKLG